MNTVTKILSTLLLLSGLAVGVLTLHSQNQKQTITTLQADNAAKASALSAIRTQLQADAAADSLAFPRLSVTIPPATVLRANRKLIKPLRGEFDPIAEPLPVARVEPPPETPRSSLDLPTAVILHRGEIVPYDSAVVIEYNQYYYTERQRSRERATEIAVGSRLPDVVLPDFMPTRKEVRRGKWRAFVGGLAVGAVAALALPLVLTR